MTALVIFLALIGLTGLCYGIGSYMERLRTRRFLEYAAALAAEAKLKPRLLPEK